MKIITHNITLDVASPHTRGRMFEVKRKDGGTHTVNFTLTENGKEITEYDGVTSYRIRVLHMDKSSTETQHDNFTGTITHTFSTADLSVFGDALCEVSLYDNAGNRLTSAAFGFFIVPDINTDEGVLNDSNYPVLDNLIKTVNEKLEDVEKMTDSADNLIDKADAVNKNTEDLKSALNEINNEVNAKAIEVERNAGLAEQHNKLAGTAQIAAETAAASASDYMLKAKAESSNAKAAKEAAVAAKTAAEEAQEKAEAAKEGAVNAQEAAETAQEAAALSAKQGKLLNDSINHYSRYMPLEKTPEDYFTVSLNNPSQITGLSEDGKSDEELTDIVFPYAINGVVIDSILASSKAFQNNTTIKRVAFPDTIKTIGAIFKGSTALTTVYMPDNISRIETSAFSNCTALTTIDIPSTVKEIETSAFSNCTALTTIDIPSTVKEIRSSAFSNCTALTTINIPGSVTTIYPSAFQGCTSLTTINIPDSVNRMGDWAFDGCTSLTTINIPDGGRTVYPYQFQGCTSLTSIRIPDSVTTIVKTAFDGCTNLTTVYCEKGSAAETFFAENKADFPNVNIIYTDVAKSELDNKVDKEDGKGLSSNDYTDEAKAAVEAYLNNEKSYTHANKDWLDKFVYIDAYPTYADETGDPTVANVDISVFNKMDTNCIYTIDVKKEFFWNQLKSYAAEDGDFTPSGNILVETSEIGRPSKKNNTFCIIMRSFVTGTTVNVMLKKNMTIATQYFVEPSGKVYSRQIIKSTSTETGDVTYTYSDFKRIDGDDKVDKVAGKGLSSNDYTSAEKAEVAKIKDKADKADVKNDMAALKLKSIPSAEAEGYPITVNDQLADEEPIKLNIYGFNKIIPYPYKETTKTTAGITFTDNGDGTITANGTAAETTTLTLSTDTSNLEVGKTYTISDGVNNADYFVRIIVNDVQVGLTTTKPTFTISENITRLVLAIRISEGAVLDNVIFKPQIDEGETASEWKPYQSLGTLDSTDGKYKIPVTVGGKNILPYPYYAFGGAATKTINGITFTDNGDGSITLNGTSTAEKYFEFMLNSDFINSIDKTKTYTMSVTGIDTTKLSFEMLLFFNATWVENVCTANKPTCDFSAYTKEFDKARVALLIKQGASFANLTVKPMLEIGGTATEYEPYKEPQTITASLDTALKPDEYIDIIGKKRYKGNTVTDITTNGNLKMTDSVTNIITCGTSAQPSKIELSYFQDINKVLANLTNAILAQGGNV